MWSAANSRYTTKMMGKASHRRRIISSAAWAVALAVLALCAVSMIDERTGVGEHSLAATAHGTHRSSGPPPTVDAAVMIDDALDTSSVVSAFYMPQHHSMPSMVRDSGISSDDQLSADRNQATNHHTRATPPPPLRRSQEHSNAPVAQLTEEKTSGAYWEKAFSDDLDLQSPTSSDDLDLQSPTSSSSSSLSSLSSSSRPSAREFGVSLASDLDDAVQDAVDSELSDAPTTIAHAIGERIHTGFSFHRRGFSSWMQPRQRHNVDDSHSVDDAQVSQLRPHPIVPHVRSTTAISSVGAPSFPDTAFSLAPTKADRQQRQKEVSAAVTEAQSALQKASFDKKTLFRATKIAQKVVATELVRAKKIQKEVETNPKAVKRVKKVVSETEAEVALVKRQMARATADLQKQLGRVNHAAVVTKGTHAERATVTKQTKVKKMAQAIKSASVVPGAKASPATKKDVAKIRKQLKHIARHIVQAQARKYAIAKHASRVANEIKATKNRAGAAALSKSELLKQTKLKQKLKNLRKRRKAAEAKVKALKVAGKVAGMRRANAAKMSNTKTNHAQAAQAAAAAAAQKAKAAAQFDRLASPQSKARSKFLLAKAKATHDQTQAARAREHANRLARQAEAAAHKLHSALMKQGHQ